jgi:uncharacterized integral membrane protein (TIGR00697 family)
LNQLLWAVMLLFNFIAIMMAYRFWGKTGLYIWMPISVIVANIQVTKTVMLFGMEATLGNIVYATSFLATDILSEYYGSEAAKKAVKIGFFSLVTMTILMQFALMFESAPNDIAGASLQTVFGLMPRIALGSLVAYIISNLHDVFAFNFWKKRTKPLWIRNNFSTFVSQTIDSVLFTAIAFAGTYEMNVLIQIFVSTLVLKWIVAICDTPFMYLSRKWVRTGKIADLAQVEPLSGDQLLH